MLINKIIILLLFSTPAIAGDFSMWVGVSRANSESAKPELNFPNPLGILRIEYETERETTIFCEHISSIPKTETGSGLNHCGVMFKL